MTVVNTFSGDQEINTLLGRAMNATIHAMHKEGIITEQQADEFLDTHVCLLVNPKIPLWERVARRLGFKSETNTVYVNVFKPSM